MNQEEIKKILPHRDHMLLIDEAELREGKAYGKKTIRGDEFFLQGTRWSHPRRFRSICRRPTPPIPPANGITSSTSTKIWTVSSLSMPTALWKSTRTRTSTPAPITTGCR